MTQQKYFGEIIKALKRNVQPCSSSITNLNPFLDEKGILRAGGRLRKASLLPMEIKHPIILPNTKDCKMSELVIRHFHESVGHGGRNVTLNEIRSNGFWIIRANAAVRSVIYKCVKCRKLRGTLNQQIMADLPAERIQESPPFTHCGVDMFGPFTVKERRSMLKRYAALFTCFSCRAIHIEITSSLETDTFILALRRMIARRGSVRIITSDNGTNFVGAKSEIRKAFNEMNHQRISNQLLKSGTDWIIWKRNTPTASNMGGVWERHIRSARSTLASLLSSHPGQLNDESLRTLMAEVEAIVNSRPLTVETLSDVNSLQPICPINLLTTKTKVILPPPGRFQQADLYSRKYWRRVQHLADEFWTRWRKEFLLTLQNRTKWSTTRRNIMIGDIVILKEETRRNCWPLARVVKLFPDEKGFVRSVQIWVPRDKSVIHRPCNKLVVLVEVDSPTRSHDV